MKRTILQTILLLGIATGAARATVLTLEPIGGAVEAPPGGTTGWGFTFEPLDPSKWVSIIGSILLFETNPSAGSYTDLIGAQGGPSNGALPPGSPAWMQTFDLAAATGAGFYDIDPFAIPGSQNSGTLRVLYEVYSGNPATCGGCFESAEFADADFVVQVGQPANPVPEPGAASLMALSGAMAFSLGRLRRR